MTGVLAALNDSWLNDSVTVTATNTGGATGTTVTSGAVFSSYSPWYPQWYYTTTERRPIRLTLTEVQRLRAAAKRDAKLKAILAKFTDQIEVEVDLG